MAVRIKFPAGGQVIRVPLTISIPQTSRLVPNELETYIIAHGNLPLSIRAQLLCDSILSIIQTSNNVSTSVAIQLKRIIDELVLGVSNRVESWIRVDEDIVNSIGMTLNAYYTNAQVLIDLVGESAFESGLVISASDAADMLVQMNPNLKEDADLILRNANDVVIASIDTMLGTLSNQIIIDEGAHITLIGDIDPEHTGTLDPTVIPDITKAPTQPYLEIGLIENDEGRLNLEIRAADDVRAIRTEPVLIGYIDPNTIGELDPDHVPDGRIV